MTTNQPTATVLGIERADARQLSAPLQRVLGEALISEPVVEAAWVAVEEAGSERSREHLQIAILGSTNDPNAAARSVWPVIERLQRQHRVTLAVEMYRRPAPDVVPAEVAKRLGLRFTPNPRVRLQTAFPLPAVRSRGV